MKTTRRVLLFLALLTPVAAAADDLRGAQKLLCSASQVTGCWQEGDCSYYLPADLNVPQFIEVDLAARKLATTRASGENRQTPIEQLRREDGLIVLQGFQNGRAFSFAIEEETGVVTVAVASQGRGVIVFGACTPMEERR